MCRGSQDENDTHINVIDYIKCNQISQSTWQSSHTNNCVFIVSVLQPFHCKVIISECECRNLILFLENFVLNPSAVAKWRAITKLFICNELMLFIISVVLYTLGHRTLNFELLLHYQLKREVYERSQTTLLNSNLSILDRCRNFNRTV